MAAPAPPTSLFSGPARPLAPDDLDRAAAALGCERAVVEAVLTVETGGAGGFLRDGSGRPRILFEAHIFSRETAGQFNASHPSLSRAQRDATLYLGGAAEYGRLNAAMVLDKTAAIRATSWGLFQIMGFNFAAAGFPDPWAYVEAQTESEGAHLDAFVAFCTANRLGGFLRARAWAEFARRYNGPAFRENAYDTKLEAAYQRAAGRQPDAPDGTTRPTLRIGSQGEPVRRLQRALRTQEAHLSVDGIFGRATEAAVMRVQRAARLPADGIVGPMTWNALAPMMTASAA